MAEAMTTIARETLQVLELAERAGAGALTVEALSALMALQGPSLSLALEELAAEGLVRLTTETPGRTSVELTPKGRDRPRA